MTFDLENVSPDDLIQYGKEEAVRLMEELARQEAEKGDGRALRVLQRLSVAAGLVRVKRPHVDDGN